MGMQVLKLLSEEGDAAFDTMCLLRTLGQVRTDMVDRKRSQTVDGKAQLSKTDVDSEQKSKTLFINQTTHSQLHISYIITTRANV